MAARRKFLRRRAGMTLVELLAAMAIFLGLAGMILQVLGGGGLDLWNYGERTRDESEQASALLDRLAGELRLLVANDGGGGAPDIRLACDTITFDADGDGARDFRAQRLLFVRRLVEERVHPPLQAAGTHAQSAQPYLGAIDSPETRFHATAGMVEEALVPQPDPRPGFEGRMILWRALKSPIGGAESFFAQALKDDAGLEHAPLEALAENVLYFGIGFLDDSVDDPSATPGDARGPLLVWDSTRGILPAGEGLTGFRHARGPASLKDPDDDVFPTAVQLSLITAPPPGEAPAAEITNDIPASGGTLRVELLNGRYLKKLGELARVVKIGHEWVAAAESDGTSLLITQRGLYGTAPSVHVAGSKVLVGRRFERTIVLPCGRGDLVLRDATRSRR